MTERLEGLLTLVEAWNLGGHLNQSAIAANTIYLDATTDYDEDGGEVVINDLTYRYTKVEGDTLVFPSPMVVTADVDDPVWTLDAEGSLEVEWIAWVDLGDGGDAVPAFIDTGLIDDFPEGETAAGQLVEVVSDKDDYRVVNRPQQGRGHYSGRYRNANLTIPDSTWTSVAMAQIATDANRGIEYADPRWTMTVKNVYTMTFNLRFDANSIGRREVRVVKNGDYANPVNQINKNATSAPDAVQIVAVEDLEEGDTIEVQGWQNSGSNVQILGGQHFTNARIKGGV